MISDTSTCDPDRQIKDKSGKVNSCAYYDRVKQWVKGTPTSEPGGLMKDGAYRIQKRVKWPAFSIAGDEKIKQGAVDAALGGTSPAIRSAGGYSGSTIKAATTTE